jgi:hypothetical protein
MKATTVNLEKLRNAYWRMDDALDGLQMNRTPAEMAEAWTAHKLLADILADTDPEWHTSPNPPSGATTEELMALNID